jgi:hypothetical protein
VGSIAWLRCAPSLADQRVGAVPVDPSPAWRTRDPRVKLVEQATTAAIAGDLLSGARAENLRRQRRAFQSSSGVRSRVGERVEELALGGIDGPFTAAMVTIFASARSIPRIGPGADGRQVVCTSSVADRSQAALALRANCDCTLERVDDRVLRALSSRASMLQPSPQSRAS